MLASTSAFLPIYTPAALALTLRYLQTYLCETTRVDFSINGPLHWPSSRCEIRGGLHLKYAALCTNFGNQCWTSYLPCNFGPSYYRRCVKRQWLMNVFSQTRQAFCSPLSFSSIGSVISWQSVSGQGEEHKGLDTQTWPWKAFSPRAPTVIDVFCRRGPGDLLRPV